MVYTEVFIQQLVAEFQAGGITAEGLRRKYNIGGKNTVYRWLRAYATVSTTELPVASAPELQTALAEAQLRIAYLETVLELARERGFEETKKKSAGQP